MNEHFSVLEFDNIIEGVRLYKMDEVVDINKKILQKDPILWTKFNNIVALNFCDTTWLFLTDDDMLISEEELNGLIVSTHVELSDLWLVSKLFDEAMEVNMY